MIDSRLHIPALQALHDLVIDARLLAYDGADQQKIAALLDDVDHLFNLMREADDETAAFIETLAEIGDRLECRRAYVRFCGHLSPVG